MFSYRPPYPKQRKILGIVPKIMQIIQSCKFVCCFCFCFFGSCCSKKTSFVRFKFSKETRTWEFSDSFQTTGRFPSLAISAKPRQEVLRNPSLPPSCRIAFLCLPDNWGSRDFAFEGFGCPQFLKCFILQRFPALCPLLTPRVLQRMISLWPTAPQLDS